MVAHRQPAVAPADLSAAVVEAGRHLVGAWEHAAEVARPTVSTAQMRALVVIGQLGELPMGSLAESLGLLPSSATRLCDRLETAGLVERRPSPENRRQVLVRLTKDGRRLLQRVEQTRKRDVAKVLQRMTPEGQRALLEGLSQFAETQASVRSGGDGSRTGRRRAAR